MIDGGLADAVVIGLDFFALGLPGRAHEPVGAQGGEGAALIDA